MFRLLREAALKLRLLRKRAPQPRGARGSGMRRTLTPGASLDACGARCAAPVRERRDQGKYVRTIDWTIRDRLPFAPRDVRREQTLPRTRVSRDCSQGRVHCRPRWCHTCWRLILASNPTKRRQAGSESGNMPLEREGIEVVVIAGTRGGIDLDASLDTAWQRRLP